MSLLPLLVSFAESVATNPNLFGQRDSSPRLRNFQVAALARPWCGGGTSAASEQRLVGGVLADVHHAETVSFGIGEDDVIRVRWSLVPVDLGCTQREQALDLARLI